MPVMRMLVLFLVLSFFPNVMMDDGVVLKLGIPPDADEGPPVHTWLQRDPADPVNGGIYKLDCVLSISSKEYFIVKVLFNDELLERVHVMRFDDDLLESIVIMRREAQGQHLIWYDTIDSVGKCLVRTYKPAEPTSEEFTTTDTPCYNDKSSLLYYSMLKVDARKGWKWDDVDDNKFRIPGINGAVEKLGLREKAKRGKKLHTWKNQVPGYTMTVRRAQFVRKKSKATRVAYYASIRFENSLLDTMTVTSLGKGLTHSVTVRGMTDGQHVLQYQTTGDQCQRLHYPLVHGWEGDSYRFKDVIHQPTPTKCRPMFHRVLANKLSSFIPTLSSVCKTYNTQSSTSCDPDNGWIW